MTLDTVVIIMCAIGLVLCLIGRDHINKQDVYLTYVDQRVPPMKTNKKGAKK